MGLSEYCRKRDFRRTPEPPGKVRKTARKLSFVVQKHAASRLHYDFRLEHAGVLKSWAVPKGPSLDPADKRLAVMVEDHPLDYGGFEGVIPAGEYGAGPVIIWDRGSWLPAGDVDVGLRKGKLEFELRGEKLSGAWRLIRLHGTGNESGKSWLLVKHGDEAARRASELSLTEERPESVVSRRRIEDLDGRARVKPPQRKATKDGAVLRTGRERTSAGRAGARRSKAQRSRDLEERLAGLSSARRRALPGFVAPQLATLVREAPAGADWLHEIKFDGYRMLAHLESGRVRWLSRNGLDWTRRFAALSQAIEKLPARAALIDGEVVVVRPDGTTSFGALQAALSEERTEDLTYFAFDLLHLDGMDLRPCALEDRKGVLEMLLGASDKPEPDSRSTLRYSTHIASAGPTFYRHACKAALEGILCKRRDQPYVSGRSKDWVKVKCSREQEFVVIGFTQPEGSRVGLGALVLGYYEGERLRHAGRVGTGFGHRQLLALRKRLRPLEVEQPPTDDPLPAAARRGVTWVRPALVAEVAFTEWTSDGMLRHPTFQGLREDKAPKEIVREQPASPPSSKNPRQRARVSAKAPRIHARSATTSRSRKRADEGAEVAGVEITHPGRVVYPELGVTKLELARYYESIADRILPHVAGRPISVVRCPAGAGAPCFYQKHGYGHFPADVRSVAVKEGSGTAQYLMVDSLSGLIGLVQMGAMELHPWGSRADRLEHPDRMIFDLDPAPDVPWKRVARSALLMRELLEHLGLESYLKTTGGKGLHVVVPLARRQGWDEVKAFSRELAEQMERAAPELYVASASKAKRKGRIFVDYLRNARGATAVAPYSSRARPGATVAAPLHWREIERDSLRPDVFDVRTLAQRLDRRGFRDPWATFNQVRQALPSPARKASARARGRSS